jgi:nicotinamidase/pyrazinamidase
MAKNVKLLIVDPQVDFCSLSGELYVTGAQEDMKRLASFVSKNRDKIGSILVSLDSHSIMDIAHPYFWRDKDGNNPAPFNGISVEDVENKVWMPFSPALNEWVLKYVKELKSKDKYELCIWPPHCLMGSVGATICPVLQSALHNWEIEKPGIVNYIHKGSNIITEHYSMFKAEVVDPQDPATNINEGLINYIEDSDAILVAGEAGSHCVRSSVSDLADAFKNKDSIKKIVWLEDVISPVGGFEEEQEMFVEIMQEKGMRVSTTVDFFEQKENDEV